MASVFVVVVSYAGGAKRKTTNKQKCTKVCNIMECMYLAQTLFFFSKKIGAIFFFGRLSFFQSIE